MEEPKAFYTCNEEFPRILLDIPNINDDKQIDLYKNSLKSHFFKEICTRNYENLASEMRKAESVDSSYKLVASMQPENAVKHPKKNEKEKNSYGYW